MSPNPPIRFRGLGVLKGFLEMNEAINMSATTDRPPTSAVPVSRTRLATRAVIRILYTSSALPRQVLGASLALGILQTRKYGIFSTTTVLAATTLRAPLAVLSSRRAPEYPTQPEDYERNTHTFGFQRVCRVLAYNLG